MAHFSLGRFIPWFMVLLTLATGSLCLWQACSESGRPGGMEIERILLISLDTCRADHLGCYGFPREISPNIDALAYEGMVFDRAMAPVPLTLASHSTMVTGTIPPYHGVHDNFDYKLAENNLTLQEILREEGYHTAGIVSSFVLNSRFGFAQGFDHYDDTFAGKTIAEAGNRYGSEEGVHEQRADETSRKAIDWLEKHGREKFFLFLHYFDPHQDYEPPEPYNLKFCDNLYAGEIAYADQEIGRVFAKLKELDLYDSTLIIFTSDHGEMLMSHGEATHGFFIYQKAIQVPLIIKLPGTRTPGREPALAGIIDILPTLCGLLGVEIPKHVRGEDLSPCLLGEGLQSRDRAIYCESLMPTLYQANPLLSVITEQGKYIQTTRPELYILADDPEETRNLAAVHPDLAGALRSRLAEILEEQQQETSSDGRLKMDEESVRRLEALGYLSGGKISESFDLDPDKADPKDLIGFHDDNMRLASLFNDSFNPETREKARLICEKMLAQRDDFSTVHVMMGKLRMFDKEDQGAGAIESFRKAVACDPNSTTALDALASMLDYCRQPQEAIELFQRALEINPNLAETHHNLGRAYIKTGNRQGALAAFRRALEIDPDLHRVRFDLANMLIDPRGSQEAVDHFRIVLQKSPNHPGAILGLAQALKTSGKIEEAIHTYQQALRLKPDWPAPMIALARMLAGHPNPNQRRPEEALRLAQRAAELTERNDVEALNTLAAVYAAGGSLEQAVAISEEALEKATAKGSKRLIKQTQAALQRYRKGK